MVVLHNISEAKKRKMSSLTCSLFGAVSFLMVKKYFLIFESLLEDEPSCGDV